MEGDVISSCTSIIVGILIAEVSFLVVLAVRFVFCVGMLLVVWEMEDHGRRFHSASIAVFIELVAMVCWVAWINVITFE